MSFDDCRGKCTTLFTVPLVCSRGTNKVSKRLKPLQVLNEGFFKLVLIQTLAPNTHQTADLDQKLLLLLFPSVLE